MNDELRQTVKIFARVLPNEGGIIPLIFNYFCNLPHMYSSRYFYNIIGIMVYDFKFEINAIILSALYQIQYNTFS